jgi:hypothetical protein
MARFRRVLKTVGKTSIPRAKMEAAVRSVFGSRITQDASEKGIRSLEKMVFTLDKPVQISFQKVAKNESVLIVDKNGDYTTGHRSLSKAKMAKLLIRPSGRVEFVVEKEGARSTGRVVAEKNPFGKAQKSLEGLAITAACGFGGGSDNGSK